MPVRIQRKRTKGWRMPPNTVYVGRPSRWGNPFQVVDLAAEYACDEAQARVLCVEAYRKWLSSEDAYLAMADRVDAKNELRGKDLACWCKPGEPCHADVLLEIANR